MRLRGEGRSLHGGADADLGVAISPLIPNEEALRVVLPDDDEEAMRAHVVRADISPREQALAGRGVGQHNRVHHLARRRHLLVLADECDLLVPELLRRLANPGPPDQPPRRLLGVRGECILEIPADLTEDVESVEEQVVLHPIVDAVEAQADVGDEHVGLAASAQRRLAERDVRKRRLRLGADEAESLGDLGDAEKILAHDIASGQVALRLLDQSLCDDALNSAPERLLARLFQRERDADQFAERPPAQVVERRALREKSDQPTTDARCLFSTGEQKLFDLRWGDECLGHDYLPSTGTPWEQPVPSLLVSL